MEITGQGNVFTFKTVEGISPTFDYLEYPLDIEKITSYQAHILMQKIEEAYPGNTMSGFPQVAKMYLMLRGVVR